MSKWAAQDMFKIMRPSAPQEQKLYENMLNDISIPIGRSIFDMDIEVDYCDICHKQKQVQRKYYHYGIDCLCCGSPQGHFEIVRYCEDCEPVPPKYIQAEMRPLNE